MNKSQLILKVIAPSGDEVSCLTVNQERVTIGRKDSNSLVLVDEKRHISGLHASIDYQNEGYFIIDKSTNGLFVNCKTQLLGTENSIQLNDQDQLYIGDYQINVTITQEQKSIDIMAAPTRQEVSTFPDDPFADFDQDPVQEMIDDRQWEIPSSWGDNHQSPDDFDLKSEHNQHKPEMPLPPATQEAFQLYTAKKDNHTKATSSDLFGEDWPAKKEGVEKSSQTPPSEQGSPLEKNIDEEYLSKKKPDDIFGDDWLTKDDADIPPIEIAIQSNESLGEKDMPEELSDLQKRQGEVTASRKTKEELHTESVSIGSGQKQRKVESTKVAQQEESGIGGQGHPKKSSVASDSTSVWKDHFLHGLGLEDTELDEVLTPESFYMIGKMLKTSVQGAMDVLIGRAKIKNEMHLDVTMIRPKENNPIKLSVSAEEAIKKMLDPQENGYLPAEEAVEEAFDDIRAHQFAVISGMQTALLDVLKRFDPQKLERRFQKQSPIAANIPIHKQAKLWRAFEALYEDIEHEATDNFYHLFGQAFAESYEQQMVQLKKAKKDTPF